jgi:hypothetical protein
MEGIEPKETEMSTLWVVLTFGSAAVLALVFLYLSGPQAWYWHLLSLAVALAIGLTPIPPRWNTSEINLVIGFFFVLFSLWALAAPFVRRRRRRKLIE